MASAAIDSYKLLTTLKATGKDSNYSAEELANAFQVAQQGADLVTVPIFEARMREVDERFDAVDARFDAVDARFQAVDARFDAVDARFDALETKFDAKLDFVRADIKAEVKSSQLQNLLWLSGIVLTSNGAVIALLARATRLF
jgi:hypothetical protein